MGKGGFSESGWAIEEAVIEWFIALACGLDKEAQFFHESGLSDELGGSLWPEGCFFAVFVVVAQGRYDVAHGY